MWIFTNKGMLSVVRHREKKDYFLVRARERGVLEKLFPKHKGKYEENNEADYRFRLNVQEGDFYDFMIHAAQNINYDNFKNSIPPEKELYHDACMDVWSTMHRLQSYQESHGEK